jgi:hypothetical protein
MRTAYPRLLSLSLSAPPPLSTAAEEFYAIDRQGT